MELNRAMTKQVVGTIYEDIVKYYGLYAFTKYKIKALINKPLHILSNEQFWSLLLRENFKESSAVEPKLLNGQLLTFSNKFYLSEWAPKIPGKIWTKSSEKLVAEALDHQILDSDWKWKKKYEVIFDEYGKKKAMEAGFGSVRINPSNNQSEAFMYMSLTTADNWDIDSGIPIIVSKSVFEEYRNKSENNGAVEIGKLEGILIIDMDLPINSIISNAIGAQIDVKVIDILTKQPNLPKCFVYVPSTLGVNFKFNNSHPECTGWTLYKKTTNNESEKNYNQRTDYEFGVTYNCFDPTKPESLIEAVDFMKDYISYNQGSEILTDFDGMMSNFESRLNLKENPMTNQKSEFKKVILEINEWVESFI